MMQKVYGDGCLSLHTIYEWFKRSKEGREDLNDDQRSGQPRSAVNKENIEIVLEFIKKEPKSSLRYMEIELNIFKDSIYRILTEHLGLRKVCARFVSHKLITHDNTSDYRSTL